MVEKLIARNNIGDSFLKAKEVWEEIYQAAKEVGIDMQYLFNYWPRWLKDTEGFVQFFQGRDDWSIFEEAIKRRAEQAGRKVEDLTIDEKAAVINTLIRGYRTQALTLSTPGPAKERTVEIIDRDIDRFYSDSIEAGYRYIQLMNAKIYSNGCLFSSIEKYTLTPTQLREVGHGPMRLEQSLTLMILLARLLHCTILIWLMTM